MSSNFKSGADSVRKKLATQRVSEPDVTLTSSVTDSMDDRPESPPLPAINERLGYLRPSRELLEYYRKKIAEFDNEHDVMVKKLDDYRMTYEEQHKIQWELRQREEEISELQKALSDMQVYLFQEREHVLRLYAENDRLKIQEIEDRKKIQTLLALSGVAENEVSYFLKEPPAKAIVEQRTQQHTRGGKTLNKGGTRRKPSKGAVMTEEEEKYQKDNQILSLQVEAISSQLEEQTRLAKEQVEAMMEDRRVKIEEYDARRDRDTDKIKTLSEKLHKTQDLLYLSTKDCLESRYEGRTHEKEWMAEKDLLLRELDACKQQLDMSKDEILNVSEPVYASKAKYAEEIQSLRYQVEQANKLVDNYREQVIQLEDELSRIREEQDVKGDVYKERSEKIAKRLKLMNTRYDELEKRRNLEVAGFKTDIKNLRTKLKDIERQLYKVTVGYGDQEELLDMKRPGDIDMQILRNVRRTAGRSKHLMGELKHLKSKVYGVENDLRHL
ncbi:unnamed protein product [Owenia fusiformis]|uniref:Uncharacterized protein n=1 Tax=Owenia fusiformis TaxID=6347 RepID=A0A8J1T4S4_OWEFU|nr:unnamed protein product [Owenia fusiformis]